MSVSKERREALREALRSGEGFFVVLAQSCFSRDEFRALLDMGDERDRYRAMLVEIYRDKWTDPDLMERIERGLGEENPLIGAVLEGKQ